MHSTVPRWAALAIAALIGAGAASAQIRSAATKNVDEPGRIPYQSFLKSCNFATPYVPANQRLVITNIAVKAQALRVTISDDTTTFAQMCLPYNPNSHPADTISIGHPRRYTVSEPFRIYLDAAQRMLVGFHVTGGSLADDWPNLVLITGYLVDLAQ